MDEASRQPWLSARQVAAWFYVTQEVVYELADRGEIPYRLVGPDILRFSVVELDEWTSRRLAGRRPRDAEPPDVKTRARRLAAEPRPSPQPRPALNRRAKPGPKPRPASTPEVPPDAPGAADVDALGP